MSFFDATLMIGYSRPEYNPVFVKQIFDAIFGAGVVEQVREFVVTRPGCPTYKKFYIYTFDDNHPAIVHISKIINANKFAKVAYTHEWDRKTKQVVDRYWKVFFAPVMKIFTPYIMNETIDPWSPEADPAFAQTQQAETLVFPPPMVRDETEGWGKPCKLERSTNEILTDEEDEILTDEEAYDEKADVSKDFDELKSAIAEFGEDYPGSIAPKIPRPPLFVRCDSEQFPVYDEPSGMVRCDSVPYPVYDEPTAMMRSDSDRYNEPYMLRLETEEDGTSKICRGEDPEDYATIGPPPTLTRATSSAPSASGWFSMVTGKY
jgi:hypothetical protein